MTIQISEVWNYEGRSEILAIIETNDNPHLAVDNWINENRPDLTLARGLNSYGWHATQILHHDEVRERMAKEKTNEPNA